MTQHMGQAVNETQAAFEYSTAVYVGFAACVSFRVIGLILGAISFLPMAGELAFGALIAALFAALIYLTR